MMLLLFLIPVVTAWWWSAEETGTCGVDLDSLPMLKDLDMAAFAEAMASKGGAVLSTQNESAVTNLFAATLERDVVIAVEEGDFPLASLVKRDDQTMAVVAGPGLAVWTNGKWSAAEVTVDKLTIAYTGQERQPLPQFLDNEQAFPKYGAVPASSSCGSVSERALQIRGRLNGDGGASAAGVALRPCDFKDLDTLIKAGCEATRVATIGDESIMDPPLQIAEFSDCDPSKGSRAFDGNGTRLTTRDDVLRLINYWSSEPKSEAADVWFVPSGVHFVWPTFEAGRQTTTTVGERQVLVTTLSTKPAVFGLEAFLDSEEAAQVVERNRPMIKPSEVGLVGRAGDKTRTSSNSWDTSSPMARLLIERAFNLLKIDPERKLEDGLQVLHYEPSQWYKPHVDYFTANNGGGNGVSSDAFSNAIPVERNGTNRFATVFLYLNDTPEGGETAFPLSTSHSTYNGGRLVHPGTEKTPGFIRNEDADWICNSSSEALRVKPKTATAVLFYSQRGDASLDPFTLHGSSPVKEGEKWAANLWVWNRPRDAIDKAKDSARAQFQVNFINKDPTNPVELFWRQNGHTGFNPNLADDPSLQKLVTVLAGSNINMNTYPGHVFVAKSIETPVKTLGIFTANKKTPNIHIPPQTSSTEIPFPVAQPPKISPLED